ncbi:MAG: hypothetical protein ABH817_00360 [archaeon]
MGTYGIIDIEERPLDELLRSARETLVVEAMGVLFGNISERRSTSTWHVESVHSTQLATRFPRSIVYDTDNIDRSKWSLVDDCLGEYHFHSANRTCRDPVNWGRVLASYADRLVLIDRVDPVEIIIGFRRVNLKRKLAKNPFLVSGYIDIGGFPYKIGIGGYYYNGRLRRAEIKAPKRIVRRIS